MRRPTLTPIVAVVLAVVLLLGGYMGAYYAMLDYVGFRIPAGRKPWEWEVAPFYRIEGDAVAAVLWPAQQIDRRIRPGCWRPQLPPPFFGSEFDDGPWGVGVPSNN
jgi:hypothetical protein